MTTIGIGSHAPAGAASLAGSQATTQAAIQAAYDGISTAFGQGDLSCLMSYFTSDYTAVDERGNHLTKE